VKVVAIIPARAGSQRLPKKNRKKLLGLSLIDWSINFVSKLKFVDDTIVSTDDTIILNNIKKNKNTVKAFLRPKALSRSSTKMIDVILHILKKYEKNFDKISTILLLQPTSPLRSEKKINFGYKKYYYYKKKKSVVSVSNTNIDQKRNFKIKNNNLLLSRNKKNKKNIYQMNGNFYFASPSFLKKYKSFYFKNRTYPVVLNSKKLSSDIDTIYDFKKVEKFLT